MSDTYELKIDSGINRETISFLIENAELTAMGWLERAAYETSHENRYHALYVGRQIAACIIGADERRRTVATFDRCLEQFRGELPQRENA